jgi:hypothetical protein
VINGEAAALNETGKPSFNVLQNYGSSPAVVFYYVFGVLVLASLTRASSRFMFQNHV